MNLLDLCTFPFGISSLPFGAVLNISSILFYNSGVNFLLIPTAFTVSYNCSTFDAPVIAVETSGLLITQAMANCAIEHPIYFAISAKEFRLSNELIYFFSSYIYLKIFSTQDSYPICCLQGFHYCICLLKIH